MTISTSRKQLIRKAARMACISSVVLGVAASGVGASSSPPRAQVSSTDATAQPPSVFIAVSPVRVLDTRPVPNGPIGVPTSAPIGSGAQLDLRLAGDGFAIPATASAALLNVTIDNDAALQSFLTIWPQGETRPPTSANNALPGLVASNSLLAKLGANGGISIFNQQGAVNVVIDLVGYTVPLSSVDLPGNNLLSGAGVPANTLGDNGDFYIDTTGKVLYGPRTGGAWPLPGVSLGGSGAPGPSGSTGPQGPAGADGSKITTGTTNPLDANGANGDLYVNTATGVLWTKSGGTWIAGGSIKGADGTNGTNGAPGSKILQGPADPQPTDGVTGDIWVNTTTGIIWTKGAGGWVAGAGSIKGATGDIGPAGPTGAAGAAGAAGSKILQGPADPQPTDGVTGDIWVNTTTGIIWTKGAGGWVAGSGSIKGATGATGATGAQGVAGNGGILGGSYAYTDASLNIGVGLLQNSVTPIAFDQNGPTFGTVQRTNNTTFTATAPGTYAVTYKMNVGVSLLSSGNVTVAVNGVAQGPTAPISVASLSTELSGTVYVRVTTANSTIRLNYTSTGVLALTASIGAGSFVTVENISTTTT